MTGSARAEAIRVLAALIRTGSTPRVAAVEWPRHVQPELREPLERVGRRVLLGCSLSGSLARVDALGEHGPAVGVALDVAARHGGDVVRVLEHIAADVEQVEAAAEAARAASAGARLSGRLIAALPLAVTPFLGIARAPLFDPLGLLIMAVGFALGAAGLVWIRKLEPRARAGEDPTSLSATMLAALLRGGLGPRAALEALASRPGPLCVAARRTALGAPLAAAAHPGDRASEVVGTLATAVRLGVPLADALDEVARRRRAERQREFESAARRAPVLMILPLVCCVLPSFVLLGLAPFVRAVSLSG